MIFPRFAETISGTARRQQLNTEVRLVRMIRSHSSGFMSWRRPT